MWFYAALLFSALSALTIVASKHTLKNVSPAVFYWALMVFQLPLIFLYVWKTGFPSIDNTFWIAVLASVIFYTISKIMYFRIIKDALLSDVQPLVTLGPLFTLLFSFLILSEIPTSFAIAESAVTLFGTYILNVSSL